MVDLEKKVSILVKPMPVKNMVKVVFGFTRSAKKPEDCAPIPKKRYMKKLS